MFDVIRVNVPGGDGNDNDGGEAGKEPSADDIRDMIVLLTMTVTKVVSLLLTVLDVLMMDVNTDGPADASGDIV